MFQAPLLYLLPALTGQQTAISEGSLTLNPRYACPYSLPVILAGTEATISCHTTGDRYSLTVAFGQLTLAQGGLSVSGAVYPASVELGPGQSVLWS